MHWLAKEQNGFLLWSITNALQNTSEVYWKSQVPLTPPPIKMANIIMAYMVRHWKSLSESQGRGFLLRWHTEIEEPRVNDGARGGRFSILLTYAGADMFHDTWHGGHRGGLTVWFLFEQQLGCSRVSLNTRTCSVTFGLGGGGGGGVVQPVNKHHDVLKWMQTKSPIKANHCYG